MASRQPTDPDGHVVVLMGFDPSYRDPRGRSAVERLQEAFGIDLQMARHFVDNAPVVVKRNASTRTARHYEEVLNGIGALVDIRVSGGARGQHSESARSAGDVPSLAARPGPTAPKRRGDGPVKLPTPRSETPLLRGDAPLFADSEDIFSSQPQDVVRQRYDDRGAPSTIDDYEDIAFADEDDAPAARRDMISARVNPDDAPTAAQSAEPEGPPTCPNCGFQQPAETPECLKCGIVFAKFQASEPDWDADLRRGGPDGTGAGVVDRSAASSWDDAPTGRHGDPQQEAPGFWASIPRALLVPFWGKGALWQVILGAVLLFTGCVFAMPGCILKLIGGFLGTFAFFGLLGRYFQAAAQVGLDGEFTSPALPWGGDLGDFKADVIFPGVAYFFLAFALGSVPVMAMASQFDDMAEQQARYAGQWKIIEDGEVVDSTDDMLLISEENEPVDLDTATGVIDARTTDDRAVRVDANKNHIIVKDDAGLALDTLEDTSAPPEPEFPLWLWATFLFPLVMWPMCVTVSLIDNSLLSAFNPVRVLPAVFKGGLPYLTVVVMGVVAVTGCSFASTLIAAGGSMLGSFGAMGGIVIGVAMGLISYSYATGVQAYLMGRLAATKPKVFSHLD